MKKAMGPRDTARGHSCIRCKQRKVKCDGQRPCTNCGRAQVECRARPPPAEPRRRRTRTQPVAPNLTTQEKSLFARARRYEMLLQKNGIPVDDGPSRPEEAEVEPTPEKGSLIVERGHVRYVDNNLWTDLCEELRTEQPCHQSSVSDPIGRSGLPFNTSLTNMALSSLHPSPIQTFRLWQVFVDNVHPLSKLLHAPTVQSTILEARSNLEDISRDTEALMFAIYLAAVESLRDEHCLSILGEPRTSLLARYSHATQQALTNAEYLRTSNLVVLQAVTLYLLSMRQHHDHQSSWLLTGLAIRSGQRIGLHRDSSSRGLSPFEAEIRRRLWWQILTLDTRSAQMSGASIDPECRVLSHTKRPLNVNDCDLYPTMTKSPTEHNRCATDMVFCAMRYETSTLYSLPQNSNMSGKDDAIRELEDRLQEKFLQYCDPAVPLHLLAIHLGRCIVCQLYISVHHPRQYSDKGASLSHEETEMLFAMNLEVLERTNIVHTTECLQGYLWHMRDLFPFEAFIYVLMEMPNRPEDNLSVSKAWTEVNTIYETHPELMNNMSVDPLYAAIGNLALKSWEKSSHGMITDTPDWAERLRSIKDSSSSGTAQHQPRDGNQAKSAASDSVHHTGSSSAHSAVTAVIDGIDLDCWDWEYWTDLLDQHQT